MPVESSSCHPEKDKYLMAFQDLPSDFDPSTQWLDGHSPQHSHFNNAERIQHLVRRIKGELLGCIIKGCQILLQRNSAHGLLQTFERDMPIWRAVISMHKYGVVYLGTRTDCRDDFLPVLESNEQLFAAVDTFLCSERNAIRAVNYGVHRWITTKNMQVEYPVELVPPYAISSISLHHVAVRSRDIEGGSARLLEVTEALWDLHDFAHHTAAALSPNLYGNKYFSHLIGLPRRLTALIRSPGMSTADPKPACSDGVIFSQGPYTYACLTNRLADLLAAYLLQQRALCHRTTGAMITMKAPITPEQLAVLTQNKAYELTASEMEQRVLTRGGPAGDGRDELDAMSTADRIRHLATCCNRWMYFEFRNTIKHRAQKLAYQKVAQHMLARPEQEMDAADKELVQLILDNMAYKGYECEQVPNLWEVLLERQTA
ncbi:hypothetical protein PG990_006592 [Apiospora arundinis]